MVISVENLPENNGILSVEVVPTMRARAEMASLNFSSSMSFHISFQVITSFGALDRSSPSFRSPGEALSLSLKKRREFGSEAGAEM